MVFEPSVSPSLLAADFTDLGTAARRAEAGGAGSLHLDYMDGHYVPNITFGIDLIPALKRVVRLPLVAHLMISNTRERLKDFIRAAPDFLVLQEDAIKKPHTLLSVIRENGIKTGLAINPSRPLKKIHSLLPHIDMLLIMSVRPGFGGQKFMAETLVKMKEAHDFRVKARLGYELAVDGGVNRDTAKEILHTGANVLVAGSAVYGTQDVGRAIRDLLAQN
jgi:ribulose-phosphate 3-epimerase